MAPCAHSNYRNGVASVANEVEQARLETLLLEIAYASPFGGGGGESSSSSSVERRHLRKMQRNLISDRFDNATVEKAIREERKRKRRKKLLLTIESNDVKAASSSGNTLVKKRRGDIK